MEGKGVLTLPNGDKYDGNFKDGKYDGFMEIQFIDGVSFKGMYEEGKRHGKGTLYSESTGDKLEGVWENGVKL